MSEPKTKVAIIGAGGQLGRALLATAPPRHEVIAFARADLDIRDARAVQDALAATRPAVVINAAAYTAVDKAESERDLAFAINDAAVGEIAGAANRNGARLIHVSTDFVFDGARSTPYPPDADPNPLNVYGESKLAGEARIRAQSGLDWLILRTAWVYSAGGSNFVKTMLRLMQERDTLNVVADQIGTPTSATSLAATIWAAIDTPDFNGTHHFTDAGVASWYDFAVAIHEEARALGLLDRDVFIKPIPASQYPTPAKRPAFGVLDKHSTWDALDMAPIHWRENLRKILRELKS